MFLVYNGKYIDYQKLNGKLFLCESVFVCGCVFVRACACGNQSQ